MKILGIDTALGACSAAILEDGRLRGHAREDMPRGHAEALAPMVEALMREAKVGFAELDRLAVTTGPGTFTGQRVGLAFVRALALALKRPAIGVTTLDAMAAQALDEQPLLWAVTIFDAKRGEVYFGARSASGAVLMPPALSGVDGAADAVAALSGLAPEVALAGNGAELLLPLLRVRGLKPETTTVRQPDAAFVARIAALAAAPGKSPRPLYLRAPDAKLPGQARQ